MLGRGVPAGHIITVLGSFGTGKTTFALQFLMQGLINGEKAVFISLEEDVDSVVANAASFGWDLRRYLKEKKLHIVKLEPVDAKTTVTRIRSELPDFIKRSGASRVAIDSISLLNMLFADDTERREKLFADLVRLENERRNGKLADARYEARRESLLAALEHIYGALDSDDSGPEPADRGLAA